MFPMTKLTIVANIKANPDKVDLVKAELLKLIDVTRAEQGCINYDSTSGQRQSSALHVL
jgi:quinol monooxygenase YgiN